MGGQGKLEVAWQTGQRQRPAGG